MKRERAGTSTRVSAPYKVVNIVLILFILYLYSLPFLLPLLTSGTEALPLCQLKLATGSPCPFCGITTDIGALFGGSLRMGNPLTIPLSALCTAELVYRSLVTALLAESTLRSTLRYDLAVHGMLAAAVVVYVLHWFSLA